MRGNVGHWLAALVGALLAIGGIGLVSPPAAGASVETTSHRADHGYRYDAVSSSTTLATNARSDAASVDHVIAQDPRQSTSSNPPIRAPKVAGRSADNLPPVRGGAPRAGGRASKLGPIDDAPGPHTVFRRGQDGRIDKYTTFDEFGNEFLRFRGSGGPHAGLDPPLFYGAKPGNLRSQAGEGTGGSAQPSSQTRTRRLPESPAGLLMADSIVDRLRGLDPDTGEGFSLTDFAYARGNALDAFMYLSVIWPTFVEFSGMVFREVDVETEDDRSRVRAALDRSPSKSKTEAEKSFSWIDVGVLFAPKNFGSSVEDDQRLATTLRDNWSAKLRQDFPSRTFVVEVVSSDFTGGSYGVRFFEDR